MEGIRFPDSYLKYAGWDTPILFAASILEMPNASLLFFNLSMSKFPVFIIIFLLIKNSVAYANGYLEDGTDAGNGNGFKMGGDSLSGYHKLIDSVAYDNKSKGIDSNSCPDIQVTNCTTFNNEKSTLMTLTSLKKIFFTKLLNIDRYE